MLEQNILLTFRIKHAIMRLFHFGKKGNIIKKGGYYNMKHKWLAGLLAIAVLGAMGGCSGAGNSSASQKAEESSTGKSSAAEESSDTKESQNEDSSDTEKNDNAADESKVLFEDSTVRITYAGTDEESWMGKGLKVTIENLSDKNISVQTREASVNGVMGDPYFSCDVASGKTANDTIYFSTKDELGTVELSFHIFDSDTFDTIADTEKVTLVIDDSITSEKTEADKIYEVNGVVVSYAGKVDDDIWGTEFQFLIENNGTETYTVRAENISIDNTMYDGSMYAEVAAGKYANETMSFIGEELPAEMNELEFKLVISNSSYETVAESDPIKVSIQ